ncbi:MAG TPA: hypothetical protein PLU87_15825 [Sedimentisphaerales bacterium]|nr:hypothetical protein [Sedimentisphaerales bacterium]
MSKTGRAGVIQANVDRSLLAVGIRRLGAVLEDRYLAWRLKQGSRDALCRIYGK